MADPDYTRDCVRCGTPFPLKRGPGRKPIYCGDACRDALRPAARRKNGVRVAKPCEWCGTEMRLKPSMANKRVACSRSCGSNLKNRNAGLAYRRKTIVCAGCHKQAERTVRTSKDSGRFCSKSCYFVTLSKIATERDALRRMGDKRRAMQVERYSATVAPEVAALRKIARLANDPAKNIICPCCGKAARRKRPFFRFCSLACKRETSQAYREEYKQTDAYKAYRRAAKSRRRAMLRGVEHESIDPIKVFERDKWLCHLCGCKTLKSKRGTYEDRAPELEHIVSLADGGSHTWGNVACSCRKCNIEKGARSIGQLGFAIG